MHAEPPLPSVSVPIQVPTLLSIVAGYVDACTFLGLFGLFVAQVTGSFVILGAQLIALDHGILIKVLAIPAFFFAGLATTVLATVMTRNRWHPLPWTLALETVLLLGFTVTALAGAPLTDPNAPAALSASLFGLTAMGVQSALVRLLMAGVASTNVMTTNTTQLAIDVGEVLLALCLRARASLPETQAARRRLRGLLPLIAGFACGAMIGAVAFYFLALWCLPAAAVVTAALAGWSFATHRLPPLRPAD
jgi:uncharacterized membrane protein YoaK (UPF0700 family)